QFRKRRPRCLRPNRASIEPSNEDRPMNQQVRITDWLEGSRALQSETIELRRSIHREPELGLKTPKTLAKVKAALAGLPLQLKSGPSTTGLIAILEGGRPGRTVLLRGDMDALP